MNEDFSNFDADFADFDPEAFDPSMFTATAPYGDVSGLMDPGMLMAIMGIMWIVILATYIYSAICWMVVAKRTNTPNGWFAFIPVLNIILMLQIAKRPLWWLILMLIPFVNIVISIMVFVDILKVLKRPAWWVILMFVPIVNFVVMGIMAWGGATKSMPTPPPAMPTPPAQPMA